MSAAGTRIGDRYVLGELLGRGGMAEVRKAIDTRLNRSVAIKQLRTDLATDPTFQARFRREAQAAAGLNHPTIVSVYDTGEETDPATGIRVPYIVMELIEGITLRDVLRDGRKILPERALELTGGVLDALSYSHKAGIVHRDIKPANVMLTPAGDVKVMDFGIARAVADTSSTMTQTAAVIGTAQYLSPEQARGETVDARSDIYSAGCLLYELLTGRPPFIGESPVSVAYQHVREQPVPPSQLDPEVTPDMDTVVMRALAKDPADRYRSARLMKDDINRLLNGQPPAPSQVATSSPTPSEMATAVLVPDRAGGDDEGGLASVGMGESDDGYTEQTADAPTRSRGPKIAFVTIVALALVALIGVVVFINTRPGEGSRPTTTSPPPLPPSSPQMVIMPDVTTRTSEQAVNTLTGLGLKVTEKTVQGANDSSVGQVIQQNPPGQTPIAPGSQVTITINVGPARGKIPRVVDKPVSEAKTILQDAGFTKVTTEPAASEEPGTKKDSVLAVTPNEDTDATFDAPIVLSVATGQGMIPDLSGMSQERAEIEARNAGFTIAFAGTDRTGTVTQQSPTADTLTNWGSTVTVTMSGTPQTSPAATPATTPSSPSSTESSAPTSPGQTPQ